VRLFRLLTDLTVGANSRKVRLSETPFAKGSTPEREQSVEGLTQILPEKF
jgi:hypothetical protein